MEQQRYEVNDKHSWQITNPVKMGKGLILCVTRDSELISPPNCLQGRQPSLGTRETLEDSRKQVPLTVEWLLTMGLVGLDRPHFRSWLQHLLTCATWFLPLRSHPQNTSTASKGRNCWWLGKRWSHLKGTAEDLWLKILPWLVTAHNCTTYRR